MVVTLAGEKKAKIQEGEILRTPPLHNKVLIRFQEGEINNLDPAELGTRATVYEREERTFVRGDQIIFVRNSRGRGIARLDGGKNAGVRNDGRGEIEEITAEKGQVRGRGQADQGEADLFRPRTSPRLCSHRSQGRSGDRRCRHLLPRP